MTILHNSLDNHYCLAIFSIDKIIHRMVPSKYVSMDVINECEFTGTILRIQSIKNVSIIWSGVYDDQISEINGAMCCPIKCSVSYNEERALTEFSTVDLIDTKKYLKLFFVMKN